MTNMKLLSKIKDFANEQKELLKGFELQSDFRRGETAAYSATLSFLSNLESEKPINQDDIDTEIGHWMDHLDDKYCMLVNHYSIQDIEATARHFAQWGAEHLKK